MGLGSTQDQLIKFFYEHTPGATWLETHSRPDRCWRSMVIDLMRFAYTFKANLQRLIGATLLDSGLGMHPRCVIQ